MTTPPDTKATGCTEQCRAPVYCTKCGRRKKPIGRDTSDNGLCTWDCEGYGEPPEPGHLWPNEPLPGEAINGDDY